jgi:hypothetical protein
LQETVYPARSKRGIFATANGQPDTVYTYSTLTSLFLARKFFMSIRRLPILFLLLAGTAALAGPAPWYWWVSKLDGDRVCRQTGLGQGWTREPIAFKDARCRIRLEPR